ncbi:hypothetical protein GCM10010361_62920 [Streptomyces olivaceiscleroticus]|uniref:Uncharacterized protein n=1 Tax=Streptomyces olivaceiscleroticus TaxID=68245 RepID=A0ABN1B2W0_9ACTN
MTVIGAPLPAPAALPEAPGSEPQPVSKDASTAVHAVAERIAVARWQKRGKERRRPVMSPHFSGQDGTPECCPGNGK